NRRAVELVGQTGFPHFNIDLIYGLPGQTEASWLASLDEAAASRATSLFLYPLYIRPLTGLDRRAEDLPCPTPPEMGRLYDLALPRLEAAGFRQITMRQFLRSAECGVRSAELNPELRVPHSALRTEEYRCQHDGMVGFGAGARSY